MISYLPSVRLCGTMPVLRYFSWKALSIVNIALLPPLTSQSSGTCQISSFQSVLWMSPILPFINDTKENLDGLLDYCIKADVKGIICFGMGMTLRNGNREYFYQKLDEHFPGLKRKYQETYGYAYEVGSPNGRALFRRFQDTCRANQILCTPEDVFAYINEFPQDKGYEQLSLFDM